MDYTTRYGLEFNPFLKNSREILVETKEKKETLFRLDYLVKTKGFGLLTGSAGRGKTTIIRNWALGLNPSLYKVIYTSLSTLTANDFYRNLAVFCKHFLENFAKYFWRILHLQIGESCKASAGNYSASHIAAIADYIQLL